jgi:hypothetical protein
LKTPLAVIVPPVAVHATPVFELPVMVAVNVCWLPAVTVAEAGLIATATAGIGVLAPELVFALGVVAAPQPENPSVVSTTPVSRTAAIVFFSCARRRLVRAQIVVSSESRGPGSLDTVFASPTG